MKTIHTFLVLGSATLLLGACSDLRDDLGLGRSSPDEFAVVDRAPLSMPPDYTLRPPQPGMPRPQEVDQSQAANNLLFGEKEAPVDKRQSDVERALMAHSGATKADPNIRDVVDREASQRVVGNEHLVDDILWWKKEPLPGTVVDAKAEAARIKAAKTNNQPINQGATPVIEKQKSGWLGL